MQGRNLLAYFFVFYVLPATLFSLTAGHTDHRRTRCFVRLFVTALTAL